MHKEIFFLSYWEWLLLFWTCFKSLVGEGIKILQLYWRKIRDCGCREIREHALSNSFSVISRGLFYLFPYWECKQIVLMWVDGSFRSPPPPLHVCITSPPPQLPLPNSIHLLVYLFQPFCLLQITTPPPPPPHPNLHLYIKPRDLSHQQNLGCYIFPNYLHEFSKLTCSRIKTTEYRIIGPLSSDRRWTVPTTFNKYRKIASLLCQTKQTFVIL